MQREPQLLHATPTEWLVSQIATGSGIEVSECKVEIASAPTTGLATAAAVAAATAAYCRQQLPQTRARLVSFQVGNDADALRVTKHRFESKGQPESKLTR